MALANRQGLRSVSSFDGRTYVWAGKVTVPATTQMLIEMASNTAIADRAATSTTGS
jgi:hypothetical protein